MVEMIFWITESRSNYKEFLSELQLTRSSPSLFDHKRVSLLLPVQTLLVYQDCWRTGTVTQQNRNFLKVVNVQFEVLSVIVPVLLLCWIFSFTAANSFIFQTAAATKQIQRQRTHKPGASYIGLYRKNVNAKKLYQMVIFGLFLRLNVEWTPARTMSAKIIKNSGKWL